MIYKLGSIKSNRQGFQSLAELWTIASRLVDRNLELDLSGCAFFDSNMAATLGMVLALIAAQRNQIEIVRVPGPIEDNLRRNLLLVNYDYPPLQLGPTVLPFRQYQLTEERVFAEYLRVHLLGKGFAKTTEGLGKVFQQGAFEVFQNAVAHSESKLGIFVCGQFFPAELRLSFTIADAGIGICRKVRAFNGNSQFTPEAAIQWVLEGGNTTRSGRRPGGVGLKFVREFIRRNQGNLQIAAENALYGAGSGYDKLSYSLPGTTVNFEINTGDTSLYESGVEVNPGDIF